MTSLPRSAGVPYLPDGWLPAPRPRSPAAATAIFLGVFLALQALWGMARGSAAERFWIDAATVKPAAGLVNTLTPEVGARAVGSRLKAPGGGINVLHGCEGTDVLLLLAAGFAAVRLPWRRRMAGLVIGSLLVYGLNQLRIVALFYAYRTDPARFDALHGIVAPIVLILLVGLYFFAWLPRPAPTDAEPAP